MCSVSLSLVELADFNGIGRADHTGVAAAGSDYNITLFEEVGLAQKIGQFLGSLAAHRPDVRFYIVDKGKLLGRTRRIGYRNQWYRWPVRRDLQRRSTRLRFRD